MKYLNPFTIACNKFRHYNANPINTPEGKSLLDYRGVSVFKSSFSCWDYVHNGVCISQMAGFNPDKARAIIDDYLDSTTEYTSTPFHAYERQQEAYRDGVEYLNDNPTALA